ncbi:transposase [Streptococcus pneumoniae]|nr:transposase [Streptococcus pneumoniae]COP17825.1 transposase [Streptococcus pneumoniae]
MEQLHFITKLLDIKDPNIKILDIINMDTHKEIIAKLDYDAPSCPECGNQLKKYDFQKPSKIPYLETTGMPTRILLRKRRFKCYHCSKMMVHAMKAQAIVTSQGRIVSLDIAVNYCHDMKLFKMSRRNIGQAGKILADSGYQGLMKIYPQAQTPRKSSKLKPLIAEDKAYNHALSKERSKVENIFAKVKTFKMFSTTYRNHRKRFGLRMNLIAGIINYELGF